MLMKAVVEVGRPLYGLMATDLLVATTMGGRASAETR